MKPSVGAVAVAMLAIAPAGASAQEPSLTSLTKAALDRGIVTCLPTIERLAVGLSSTYRIGAYYFNQLDRPDDGLVSISMELSPSKTGSPIYVSASFISVGGACQAMVETTISWDSKCEAVAIAYPGYTTTSKLLGQIDVYASNGTERLFLVPTSATTCISIEKTVYF